MSADPARAGVRAILLDIEGTTTPVSFVFDVLFPYARRNLRRHLEQQARSPEHESLFERLHADHVAHRSAGEAVPPWVEAPPDARLASIASYVEWLMDRDSKSAALKALQGKIWEEGYRLGELVGEVFDDVPGAFERWHAQGLQIGVFSSGSVLAQQLLFRHSSAGDLTPFLQWYFDTTMGTKTEADSYRRIATAMAVPPEAVLFISDTTRELDAAGEAGMQTRLAIRPGNTPPSDGHGHVPIHNFSELSGNPHS